MDYHSSKSGMTHPVVQTIRAREFLLTFTLIQCENMHMLTRDHPSARHSAIDWSKVFFWQLLIFIKGCDD